MKMSGEFRVPTDRETVWRALNDPEVLKDCLPGCQEIEKTSDTEMTATLVIKVGPVKATFAGGVTLSDLDPPNGYTLSGQGQGGAAGFASGEARVRLVADGGETVVQYECDAKVGGKLAQIGSRLIDSTAKKLARQFFDSFAEKLGGGEDAASAGAASAGAASAGAGQPPLGRPMPGRRTPARTPRHRRTRHSLRPRRLPILQRRRARPRRPTRRRLASAGGATRGPPHRGLGGRGGGRCGRADPRVHRRDLSRAWWWLRSPARRRIGTRWRRS